MFARLITQALPGGNRDPIAIDTHGIGNRLSCKYAEQASVGEG